MSFNLSFFTNSMTSSPNLAVLSSKSYTLSLGFWISFDIWPLSFEIYIMFYVTSDIRSASLSSSIKSKTSSLACSLATSPCRLPPRYAADCTTWHCGRPSRPPSFVACVASPLAMCSSFAWPLTFCHMLELPP